MVSIGGVEPPTSGIWILRSNQLSYTDICSCLGFIFRKPRKSNFSFDFTQEMNRIALAFFKHTLYPSRTQKNKSGY